MTLNKHIEVTFSEEQLSAKQAQELALLYSWGPAVFQVSRLMVSWGLLEMIDQSGNGLTEQEIVTKSGRSRLSISCLLEASLTCRILLIDPSSERYRLSKLGWMLLHDEMTRVNLRFNQAINYRSMYYLDEALSQEKPVGLSTLGNWNTIYEALCQLPESNRNAWLEYDHFFSDNSFDKALDYVLEHKPRSVLDVGGNTGEMALCCVKKDKDVKVTVCDLPQQIEMMQRAVEGKPGAERIDGLGIDLLDMTTTISKQYDAIWMSQFIMCFSENQIDNILTRVKQAMHPNSRLYMMEVMWNRQQYPAAAFCQTMNSLYFISTASGNNKMLTSDTLFEHIRNAGLEVIAVHDQMGPGGHSLMEIIVK